MRCSSSSLSTFSPSISIITENRHDPTATHFLLRLVPSLTPIGTIRTYAVAEGNYYKLSRLAVLKPYREYRFGRDLVLALHRWVKDDAARNGWPLAKVVCHSQLPVKGFYAKYIRSDPCYPHVPADSSLLSRYSYQSEVTFPLPLVIVVYSFSANRGMNSMRTALHIRKWLLICHCSCIITVI